MDVEIYDGMLVTGRILIMAGIKAKTVAKMDYEAGDKEMQDGLRGGGEGNAWTNWLRNGNRKSTVKIYGRTLVTPPASRISVKISKDFNKTEIQIAFPIFYGFGIFYL